MFVRFGRWSRDGRALRAMICFGIATSLAGCSSPGPYVWINSLPVTNEQPRPYLIAPGDVLDVRVYNEERLSIRGRVRVDGRITLPLLGEVAAEGKAPAQLAQEVQDRLKSFLQSPVVTVQVDETHPSNFSLVGEITRPGVFPLPANTGLLEALAIGGGLTQYANPETIYVLRKTMPQRIRVTYRELTENEPHAVAFRLRDGDVIVVE
jgi:polysaccharide biosynthesis/export protein